MTSPAHAANGLRAAGATDVGRQRRVNEDRFLIDVPRGIFVVVDGVGGHAAGDTAADTAIADADANDSRAAKAPWPAGSPAQSSARTTRSTGSPPHGQTGTAWPVCSRRPSSTAVGSSSDTSATRASISLLDGRLEKITPDHSPVGAREDASELSEFEAMRHPRRNEVYRDVGSEPHEASDADFVFVAEVDCPAGCLAAALQRRPDGSRAIRDDPAHRPRPTPARPIVVAETLVAAANEAGGKDNVTVIFVGAIGVAGQAPAPSVKGPARRVAGAAAVLVVAAFAAGYLASGAGRLSWRSGSVLGPSLAGVVVVRADESIAAAIEQAAPGTTVIVEPGEYRERLTLKDYVRVVSRVPRGATLRLPGTSAESDAAVVAVGIVERRARPASASLATRPRRSVSASFCATPRCALWTWRLSAQPTRPWTLASATTFADREPRAPQSGLRPDRSGPAPRRGLSNNVFSANASSERLPAPFVVEAEATPMWMHNVFNGMIATVIPGLDAPRRERLVADNWFIATAARARSAAAGAPWRPRAMTTPLFRQIGPYEIERQIGRGGMAMVFLAHDTRPGGRAVALKVIADGPDEDAREIAAAERRGAELQRKFLAGSPYVPRSTKSGETPGYLYIAMEYLDGQDLSTVLRTGPVDPRRAAGIAIELCQFLEDIDHLGVGRRRPSALTLAAQRPEADQHPAARGRSREGAGFWRREGAVDEPARDAQRLLQHTVPVARVPRVGRARSTNGRMGARRDPVRDGARAGRPFAPMIRAVSKIASDRGDHLNRRPSARRALQAVIAKLLAPHPAHRYARRDDHSRRSAALHRGRANRGRRGGLAGSDARRAAHAPDVARR